MDVFLVSTDCISIQTLHASEIIPQPEIDVILDHFEAALRFMLNHPNERICDVNLVSNEEKRRILQDMPLEAPSALVAPYKGLESRSLTEEMRDLPPSPDSVLNSAQSMCELIEWQVEKTHQRVAVRDIIQGLGFNPHVFFSCKLDKRSS